MEWMEITKQIFEIIIFPLIGVAAIYLTRLITVKINELKDKTENEMADKYLSILNDTICDAVLTTTQTYVETLKQQGKFDVEAQKIAFDKTFNAVVAILTDDAKSILANTIGDLETYITNKIEAEVKLTKNV